MRKTAIIIASVLVIAGIALCTAAFIVGGGNISNFTAGVADTEKTHTVGGNFTHIEIHTAMSDVKILPSDGEECTVVCRESDKIKHKVEVKNGCLTISETDARAWYGKIWLNFGANYSVVVYLPDIYYDKMRIESKSGDIFVSDELRFTNVSVESISGDVKFSAAVADELSVKSVSGDVNIPDVSAKRIKATSTSGDLKLRSVKADTLVANTTSGEIRLTDVTANVSMTTKSTSGDTLIENVLSDALNMSSTSGEITIKDSDACTIELYSVSGDIFGNLLSEKMFETKTVSGDVRVPSNVNGGFCKLETVSGDIKITVNGK